MRMVLIPTILALFWAMGSAQDGPTARLGLSALPDMYVDTIQPNIGETFILYVVLDGLDGAPLTFSLQTVEWIVHTACCGDSPVSITSLVHSPLLEAAGDPYDSVVTVAPCPTADTLLLATVTFDWLLEGATTFMLSAGALSGALDCDGDAHLLQTLNVLVEGQDPAPVETESWSGIKALFRDGGRAP